MSAFPTGDMEFALDVFTGQEGVQHNTVHSTWHATVQLSRYTSQYASFK